MNQELKELSLRSGVISHTGLGVKANTTAPLTPFTPLPSLTPDSH